MGTVIEIEHAIEQLPPEELARFRRWFAEFDADQWDRQFELDVAAGRLDSLAAEALSGSGSGIILNMTGWSEEANSDTIILMD